MGNTIVVALLRSPLARLLGGVCELEFTGRRSNRAVRLPVQYARDADRVVVHVGHAAGKRWWRNFTDPHPARVTLVGPRSSASDGWCAPATPTARDRTCLPAA